MLLTVLLISSFYLCFSFFQSGRSVIQDGSAVNQILETLGSLAAVDLGSQIQDTHMSGRDKLAIQVSFLCSFLFLSFVIVSWLYLFVFVIFPVSCLFVATCMCGCVFLLSHLCFSPFSSSADKTRAFTSTSGSGVPTVVWMYVSSP